MPARPAPKLAVVSNAPAPPPATTEERPKELGLYAEVRAVSQDHERWRRCHLRGDRGPAIKLAVQAKRIFAMKGGVRRERGGFKFEERL